jgi:YD repeat-containing protein
MGETMKVTNEINVKSCFGGLMLCVLFAGVCWGAEQTDWYYGPFNEYYGCDHEAGCPDGWSTEFLFGNKDWPMPVGGCGSSAVRQEIPCGSDCIDIPTPPPPYSHSPWGPFTCDTYDVSLPGFLGTNFSIDWGEQGPNVVVGCDTVFPAEGAIKYSDPLSDRLVKKISRFCDYPDDWLPQDRTMEIYVAVDRTDTHYFTAVYDPTVFSVTIGNPITVTLVNTDCETLRKALGRRVEIYHQKYQTEFMHADRDLDDGLNASPCKYELAPSGGCASIGVVFIGDVFNCHHCPMSGTPTTCPADFSSGSSSGFGASSGGSGGFGSGGSGSGSGSGGGGCGTCGGGGDGGNGPWQITIGNASANANYDLAGTLSMYGSPSISNPSSGTPEINAPGVWLRAANSPFMASNVSYTTWPAVGEVITKVNYSFEVSTSENNTYHYAYELNGSWEDELDPETLLVTKPKEQVAQEAFLAAAKGKVRLTHVTNPAYVSNPKSGTILEFIYDSEGNVIRQISYDENGVENGRIRYGYIEGSLSRIWAGTNENQYVSPSSSPGSDPIGGRWVDLSYSGTELNNITYGGCSSCRAPHLYENGGPNAELTKIKKTDGTVLATYAYDSKGRYTSYSIGQTGVGMGELKVNEFGHSDFDPADPNGTTGDNMLVCRDYVDNTQYRAKVFFADDNGALTKEIRYHQLQDDPEWLKGPYSVYKYYHQTDEIEGLRYVTEYPKGNKLRKYYDNYSNVIKVQWDGASGPQAEFQYQSYYAGNSERWLVWKEINAYGGTTEYTYEGTKVKTRTEPAPGTGISDSSRQVTMYTYNAQNRVELEQKKDSTGVDVYTKYEYDIEGNLKKRIENYNASVPTQGLFTTYAYNAYNQLIQTTYPSNKVEKKFYSNSGTLIAEAVYDNAAADSAVSATIYEYDDGKLKTTKTAKMNTSFTFTQTEAENGTGITWVSETYEYDDYGRRTAVIADAGGKALRTEYEYNNQGEVIKVLKPDKRYIKTIRDGRGLVVQEITGVQAGNVENDKATTRYFYDLNGNRVKKVDPKGVTELYQYDSKDRKVQSRRGK